jgi:hypothetical protein
MNLKWLSTISVIFLLQINIVQGQKIFRSGYIITNKKDTLNGFVQFDEKNTWDNVTFKRFEIANTLEYYPSDLEGYGFTNANFFEKKLIDNKPYFVECYVKGSFSLYGLGRRIFVQRGQMAPIEIKKGQIHHKTDGGDYYYDDYIHLLKALTKHINGIEVPQNTKINIDELTKLVVSFNTVQNNSYKVFDRQYAENVTDYKNLQLSSSPLRFGIVGSYDIKSTSFYSAGYYYNTTPTITAYHKNPSFGVFANWRISKMSLNYALQSELRISSVKTQNFLSAQRNYTNSTHYIDLNSNALFLKLPFSFQYTLNRRHLSPFASVGFAFNLQLSGKHNGTLFSEDQYGTVGQYVLDKDKITARQKPFTYFAGAGLKYKLTNGSIIFIEARAEFLLYYYDKTRAIDSTFEEEFYFKYMFTPSVHLIHKSPIYTFNVGFSF